jgi:FkbM family methyltransferase
MKGFWRVQHGWARFRSLAGTACLLRNWRELREESGKEIDGAVVRTPVPLRFRSGLEIGMVDGGYQGFRFLFPEIYLEKCYQPTRAFVPRKGWTVVDLGANVGFFAVQAARRDPSVRVVAVEPVPAYVEVLKQNLVRNRLTNVHVLPAAICAHGTPRLPLDIWYTASGEPMMQWQIPGHAARVETIHVPGLTLAEVFETGHIERCDLLKIDVEGAEYELFESVPARLWKTISRIVMEVHAVKGRAPEELTRTLVGHGFRVEGRGHLLWATR